jgi:hypothetical protein
MKFLIMQPFQSPVISSKYSPKRPVLKHLQSTFFPLEDGLSYKDLDNMQNYSFMYLNLYSFTEKIELGCSNQSPKLICS